MKKIKKWLGKSPINYFSDLFIVAMVISWIAVVIIMVIMAVYSTIRLMDNTIWSNVESLTAVPLTAGGAIWMIKNSVQHAIFNNKNKIAPSDFPKVEVEYEGIEKEFTTEKTEEVEG